MKFYKALVKILVNFKGRGIKYLQTDKYKNCYFLNELSGNVFKTNFEQVFQLDVFYYKSNSNNNLSSKIWKNCDGTVLFFLDDTRSITALTNLREVPTISSEIIDTDYIIIEVVPFKKNNIAIFTEIGEIFIYEVIGTDLKFLKKSVLNFRTEKIREERLKITAADIKNSGSLLAVSRYSSDEFGLFSNSLGVFRIKSDFSITFWSELDSPPKNSISFFNL